MAKDNSSCGGPLELGERRLKAGAYQAPRFAFLALSLALGVYLSSVEGASRDYDYGAKRSASPTMAWPWQLDSSDPDGDDLVQGPLWTRFAFLEGPFLQGTDGCFRVEGQSCASSFSHGSGGGSSACAHWSPR